MRGADKSKRELDPSVRGAAGPPVPGRAPERGEGRLDLWIALLCCAAALWLDRQVLDFAWNTLDTPRFIGANPLVVDRAAQSWGDRLLTPELFYPIPTPVWMWSKAYAAAGLSPFLFHAMNWALHGAAAGLLFGVGRRAGLARGPAAVAVAFWISLPITAEPVAWAVQMPTVGAAAAALAALWAWEGRSRRAAWAGAGLFFVALSFKPSVLLLPAVMAVRAWQAGRLRARALLLVPMGLAAVFVATSSIGQHGEVGLLVERHGVGDRLYEMVTVAGALFRRLADPSALSPWYVRPAFSAREWAGGALALVALLGGGVALALHPRTRGGAAGLGGGVLAALWLPTSGVVPFHRYLADSHAYLPLLGAALVVGAAAQAWTTRAERGWRWVVPVVLGVLIALQAVARVEHQSLYRTPTALWGYAHARTPAIPAVARFYGFAPMRQPDFGIAATPELLKRGYLIWAACAVAPACREHHVYGRMPDYLTDPMGGALERLGWDAGDPLTRERFRYAGACVGALNHQTVTRARLRACTAPIRLAPPPATPAVEAGE